METTSRRSILRGAALTTVAALAAVPAIAEPRDPILDWAAEIKELNAKYRALDPPIRAAYDSVNGDLDGCGWPPVDAELLRLGGPFELGESVSRTEIELFNHHTEAIVSGFPPIAGGPEYLGEPSPDLSPESVQEFHRRKCEGAARLAWWDRRQAEREHNAEVTGYLALVYEQQAISECIDELSIRIAEATATSLAGAVARLEEVARVIRMNKPTDEGGDYRVELDYHIAAVFGVVDDLRRLLPPDKLA